MRWIIFLLLVFALASCATGAYVDVVITNEAGEEVKRLESCRWADIQDGTVRCDKFPDRFYYRLAPGELASMHPVSPQAESHDHEH